MEMLTFVLTPKVNQSLFTLSFNICIPVVWAISGMGSESSKSTVNILIVLLKPGLLVFRFHPNDRAVHLVRWEPEAQMPFDLQPCHSQLGARQPSTQAFRQTPATRRWTAHPERFRDGQWSVQVPVGGALKDWSVLHQCGQVQC